MTELVTFALQFHLTVSYILNYLTLVARRSCLHSHMHVDNCSHGSVSLAT